MRLRPWPLVLLAILQLLAPGVTIVMSAWYTHHPIGVVARAFVLHTNFREFLEVFGLPILTAAALFFINAWSYAFLIVSCLWDLSLMPFSLREAYHQHALLPQIFCDLMCIGLYAYVLHPAVRAPFVNRKLRWWQSKPRFRATLTAMLFGKNDLGPIRVNVRDVSEGGVSITPTDSLTLEVGQVVRLSFRLLEHEIDIAGLVVHSGGKPTELLSYGVSFLFRFNAVDFRKRLLIRDLVHALERQGAERVARKVNKGEEFRLWWTRLLHSHTGFVPELPQPRPQPGAPAQGTDGASADSAATTAAKRRSTG